MASKSSTPTGELKSFIITSGWNGCSGDSLCRPVRITKGTACFFAASATMCRPTAPMTPPLARTARAPTMTMLTRAIIANTAASEMSVVCTTFGSIASFLAISCPSNPGAPSATTTEKTLFLAASLRNVKVVLENPYVRITSLVWMCSEACSAICERMLPSSSISSLSMSITLPLMRLPTSTLSLDIETRFALLSPPAPTPGVGLSSKEASDCARTICDIDVGSATCTSCHVDSSSEPVSESPEPVLFPGTITLRCSSSLMK
mmetsp:Transcript_2017/g.3461  ORF Transcript_2017/g.3461 Transcript_2017/m.3461 type:complete len:262 (-) Transcript_2017:389-1174(-)